MFCKALFLSALLTISAFAASIRPLLADRQMSNCQCDPADFIGPDCSFSCWCTVAKIKEIESCYICNGWASTWSDYLAVLRSDCESAGYPILGNLTPTDTGNPGGGSLTTSGSVPHTTTPTSKKKNDATSSIAQLGVVAAVVAGVIVLGA